MLAGRLAQTGRLAVATAWLLAACLGCGEPEGPPAGDGPADGRSNLLLVVFDTLRADRLGCYGWPAPTSPNIDRLAREGVLFERAMCHVPQTLPSLSSILTGTHPPTHGVRTNGIFSLADSATTLAETLGDQGYRTGAFVAGFPLDRRFGVSQGFETYGDVMRTPAQPPAAGEEGDWLGHGAQAMETRGDYITDDAIAWLEEGRGDDRPFFLMVHYFDPHHEYSPPEPHTGFDHPYEGEIAFADAQLGRLLEHLERVGHAGDTLVAFTADHGECLGEYDRVQHQGVLVEATLRVPLVLHHPGRLPAGKRVRGLARSVDIMPTVLELLGAPVPAAVEGVSLVPSIERGRTGQREAYFETLYGLLEYDASVKRTGIVRGKWKLVHNQRRDEVGRAFEIYELYHLSEDPDELQNLARERPRLVESLREALEAFEARHAGGEAEVVSPDAATLERLKALGYL